MDRFCRGAFFDGTVFDRSNQGNKIVLANTLQDEEHREIVIGIGHEARPSSGCGTVSPRVLAVFKLMITSIFVA